MGTTRRRARPAPQTAAPTRRPQAAVEAPGPDLDEATPVAETPLLDAAGSATGPPPASPPWADDPEQPAVVIMPTIVVDDDHQPFDEAQSQRWAQANVPGDWDDARRRYDADQANAAPTAEPELDDADQAVADRLTPRGTVDGDGWTREWSGQAADRSPDQGRAVQANTRGQVVLGDGGVQGEAGRRWVRAEADGSETESQLNAGFNAADRELNAGARREWGPDGDRRNVNAGAGVQLDDHGVSGGNVRLGGGRGGRSVALSGGFTVHIDEPVGPVDDDGRYVVRGTRTWNASLAGSASRGGRGASASVAHRETRTFTRHFASREEARAWYASVDGDVINRLQLFGDTDSAAEAAALAEGDSRTMRDTDSASAGVSATFEVFRVGLTAGLSDTHEVVVTRNDGDHVRVTIRRRTEASLGATGGAFGLAVGNTGFHAWLDGAVIEYDVSGGAGSPGWEALDGLLRDQRVPDEQQGDGWQVVERSHGTSDGNRASGDLLIASMEGGSSTTDEVVTDADGTYERFSGDRNLEASTVLPEAVTEGTIWADSSESFEVETDTRDGGASFAFGIDGPNAEQTQYLLAAAAGVEANPGGVQGEADSGQWQLSGSLTEDELRRFVRAVHAGRWNPGLVGAAWVPAAETLRGRIRGSSSMDAARVAVRDFLTSTEDRGLAMIRQVLGEGSVGVDVRLADDDVWNGRAGREAMRRRIAALRERAGEDPAAARAGIEDAYRDQSRRLSAMRDRDRYRDLPLALRQQEIAANEPLLAALVELRRTTAAAVRGDAEADETPLDPAQQRLRASLEHDAERLERTYRATLRAYQACGRERRLHDEPQPWTHTHTPREAFGDAAYAQADAHWRTGRRLWTEGDAFKRDFDADFPALPRSAGPEATNRLRRLTWQAHDAYDAAHDAFLAMGERLRAVRRRAERSGRTRQYFGSTTCGVPTGKGR